jgi:transposase
VEGFLTAGNISDVTVAHSLFDNIYGCYVAEDMGYDSDAHRDFLRSQNNIPVIPGRKNRKVKIEYNKEVYSYRNLIERVFGKLKENRRLAVRYEKSDITFLSMIALAFISSII